jgi:serine/threonine protein kinase
MMSFPSRPLAGRTIGNYRLVREIGAGGMGSVWLAVRADGRYEARVAVKLLNLALLGREGAERFHREGNALARLSHPHIAHLLDAGTADGQPFLVLEYVEGQTIESWCDARALGVRGRIELFLQVLAAVSYAHRQLILHRDLKPSNILVSASGTVKLLDFGIAKLLDFGIAKLLDDESRPNAGAEPTQMSRRAFTPAYAAPEQVQGAPVSTATDVYALGVLLYVLLAGRHPTAAPGSTPVEQMRALIESEPPQLNRAVLRASSEIATLRASTPGQLARALRGDLANILLARAENSIEGHYGSLEHPPAIEQLMEISILYSDLGNEAKALELAQTAHRMAIKAGNGDLARQSACSIGWQLHKAGQLKEASDLLDQTIAELRASRRRSSVCSVAWSIATISRWRWAMSTPA